MSVRAITEEETGVAQELLNRARDAMQSIDSNDQAQVDRLCRAVTAQPAEAACAAVMGALVGNEPARDDIALLMFRRPPPGTQ